MAGGIISMAIQTIVLIKEGQNPIAGNEMKLKVSMAAFNDSQQKVYKSYSNNLAYGGQHI